MIERLQRALEDVDELFPALQEQLAELIEQHAESPSTPPEALVGTWSNLPDTFNESSMRLTACAMPAHPASNRGATLLAGNGR